MKGQYIPLVPIPKKDTMVQICSDYKITMNQTIDIDQYPLPIHADLFAT